MNWTKDRHTRTQLGHGDISRHHRLSSLSMAPPHRCLNPRSFPPRDCLDLQNIPRDSFHWLRESRIEPSNCRVGSGAHESWAEPGFFMQPSCQRSCIPCDTHNHVETTVMWTDEKTMRVLCICKIGCLTRGITSVEIIENSKVPSFNQLFGTHTPDHKSHHYQGLFCILVSEPYRVISCRALEAVCKDSLYNPMYDPPVLGKWSQLALS